MLHAGNIVKVKYSVIEGYTGKIAIVEGSYATLYHGQHSSYDIATENFHKYKLLFFDGDCIVWYDENNLELVSTGSPKLITAWCKKYASGYDIVDKLILSKGDIIRKKDTDEYYFIANINDNIYTIISMSDYCIKSRKSKKCRRIDKTDISNYKYIMSVDIEDRTYDILSYVLNNGWVI